MATRPSSVCSITSTVRSYPDGPYEAIARAIVGPRYQVSLSFIGETRAQGLNRQYRHKHYVPNILSFSLTPTIGEVVICQAVAAREARRYGVSLSHYVQYLFIHGLLHLKGCDHGSTMSKRERRYARQFGVDLPSFLTTPVAS